YQAKKMLFVVWVVLLRFFQVAARYGIFTVGVAYGCACGSAPGKVLASFPKVWSMGPAMLVSGENRKVLVTTRYARSCWGTTSADAKTELFVPLWRRVSTLIPARGSRNQPNA